MEFYRAIRTKWVIFNRWLKFMEKETLNTSSGLSDMLRHSANLHRGFHRELKNQGFLPTIYYNSRRLIMECCQLSVIFHRLQVNAQENKIFRMLGESASSLYKIKILTRCFLVMKTLRTGKKLIIT